MQEKYIDRGKGDPIVLLHGLMGAVSNFESTIQTLPDFGYRTILPMLPLYELPVLKTNVNELAKFVNKFMDKLKIKKYTILGNSLGGHIGLLLALKHPDKVNKLILSGSSGLYENTLGGQFPKRGDYNYIKSKTQEVFYNPKKATKKLVDEVFEIVNSREKVLRVLMMAKSAIRHNMKTELPKIHQKTCIIWGENDKITPPRVGEEFYENIPNSEIFWIDKCGHAPMIEKPDRFNKILTDWLKKCH
ncbi:MAG: alpha/beta hydrolase [Flavobacteriales bacterium]|nr:alpha/beta hydrolase [Flavobacteriales bacterium]|tara:strand:+ start:11001 stop:11738 length:738 start_codon:yes stop_codon:yes gene_type:complete